MNTKYYQGKDMKELINPKRTNLHPVVLKHKMKSAKEGQQSLFLASAYGCGVCILKENCEEYPSSKGICLKRSRMYAVYLKAGKGEILPIMIDQLAKHSMERDIEHEKGILTGKMSDDFFKHSVLCIKLQEKIQSAMDAGKEVEPTDNWLVELRGAKKIVEAEYVNGNNDSSEQGTEKKVSGETSGDSEVSG